jgi:Zn-dependent M28 family amino/carboxypeptidase
MEKTKANIVAAGQKVYYEKGLSIVAGGGSELPNITGLDGCGAELDTAIIPVSSHSIKPQSLSDSQQKKWTVGKSNIVANPTVQAAVDDVSQTNLANTVTTLQTINTRNSYSATLHDAEDFVAKSLEAYGFTISYQQFRPNMAPNVIATWTPNADAKEWVVAGAHLDSRSEDNQSETDRAPGADDNGTGSAAILEVARLINQTDIQHNRGLRLCLFTGEEQGLVGSRAIASKWAEDGENIYAMANADMLGYTSTPEIEQAFMDRSMDPTLTQYSMDLIATYVPGLPTAFTTACCSDQQSFYENGYPSVGFFESSNSATAYPSYHKKTDLLENLSLEQLTLQTQAYTATVFSLLLD